jgi:hypothetical protein
LTLHNPCGEGACPRSVAKPPQIQATRSACRIVGGRFATQRGQAPSPQCAFWQVRFARFAFHVAGTDTQSVLTRNHKESRTSRCKLWTFPITADAGR